MKEVPNLKIILCWDQRLFKFLDAVKIFSCFELINKAVIRSNSERRKKKESESHFIGNLPEQVMC